MAITVQGTAMKDIPLNTDICTKSQIQSALDNAQEKLSDAQLLAISQVGGKMSSPSGGSAGNVLRKTATGTEWGSVDLSLKRIPTAEGYYYNGAFYSDSSYTSVIVPVEYGIYYDYLSNLFYQSRWDVVDGQTVKRYEELPIASTAFVWESVSTIAADVSRAIEDANAVLSSTGS